MMKVHELIEILEEMDPEAEVYIMSQRAWPFENHIHGVAVRGDFQEADADAEPAAEGESRWTAAESELPASDVFIVQGEQARYGSAAAWDAARRP